MKPITFTASPCTITTGKKPSFNTVAYNGGPLRLHGFPFPVIVDLASCRAAERLPILRDHAIERPVGFAESVSINPTNIVASGTFIENADAKEVIQASKSGFPWSVSIGANPDRIDEIQQGQSVVVNGKRFVGPILVARDAVLREISVVSLGADREATVSIAARFKGTVMTFEEWLAQAGIDESTLSDAERVLLEKAFAATSASTESAEPVAAAAESARIAAIETITSKPGIPGMDELRASAISTGLAPDVVQARALSLIRAGRGSAGPHFHVPTSGWTSPKHIQAGILVRAGYSALAEKTFGPHVMEQSRPLHQASLMEIAAASLRAAGREVPQSKDAVIRAAFSTGSLPTALGSSADKVLYEAYATAPASWRSFATIRQASNFKTQTGVRGTFFGDLEEVGDAGEVKHGHYGEETYEFSVGQFAKQLVIGRKSIINDDLGLIDQFAPAMGRAAARTLNDKVITTMLSGHSTFWTTGNSNYIEGAATNLQASSLASAIKKLRDMKDAEGSLLDLEPAVLMVPSDLEQTARELLESAELMRYTASGTDRVPTGNAMKSVATLVVEPRLSDTAFTGYSTTAWWLFSAPTNGAVVVAFLNGVQNPTSETFDLGIDHLGMGWRVVHDFGCALGDYRVSIRSKGAA